MLGAGLRLAVGTFTRIPSGEVSTSPGAARAALLLAPVAVLPLALLAGLVAALVELRVPPLVAAGLALAVLAHGSRGMHLDGLADLMDGLGAGWDRSRALHVMRSGDVGPMGATALALVLLIQAAALAHLLQNGRVGALLFAAAVLASRAMAALVCVRGVTPVEGSRLGATFVGTVSPFAVGVVITLTTLVMIAAGLVQSVAAPIVCVVAVVLGVVAALWVRQRVVTVLGGVGGDAIGAAIELALTLILLGLTVAW